MFPVRRLFALILLLSIPAGSQVAQLAEESYRPPSTIAHLPVFADEKVKNIILLIGDGMSVATVSHARLRGAGVTGCLHMDRMPIAGFVRTVSADKLITDSAAASTAMASGFKTNNGMIGRTPDGQVALSIFEACQNKGMAAGLVATSSITHATPAGFGAHAMSRKEEPLIAEQLLRNRIDVLLGGGKAFFIPQTEQGSRRKDDRNLLDLAAKQGYGFVQTKEEMLAAADARLLGLFSLEGLTTKPPEPSLAELTENALRILNRNKKGFILMVEGSQIDWANSANDQEGSARQTLNFDMAVAAALRFAEQNKHTLVVVTADHETGGMAINAGNADGSNIELVWTRKGHTGSTVPLYSYGPGAQRLSGFHENTDIPRVFSALLKISRFPALSAELGPNLTTN